MKAILVIDTPKACGYCGLMGCEHENDGYCCYCYAHDMDKIVVDVLENRPDWCPLRPLPEKRNTTSLIETKHEAEENRVTPQHQAGFNLGWNACLEAITGGTYDETEDD